MIIRNSIIVAILACVIGACHGHGSADKVATDTVAFRHARLIHIENFDDYAVARIDNPWDRGKTLHTYVIVPAGKPLPHSMPEGTVLRTPLHRTVVFTSAHCGLLASLGRLDAVTGVCDFRYILLPVVQRHVRCGKAADMGLSMQPDVERIINAHPDALLVSPFANTGGYGKLETVGIPLIECADYMESSPLARAEWMRFFGILYGCRERADSLFAVVEKNYRSLQQAVAVSDYFPRLMCDLMQSAAWYVPGGESTMGRAFKDAGADYIFGDNDKAGSVGKTFEEVYEAAYDADVWVIRSGGTNDVTYASLKNEREAYTRFLPWKKRHIFACNTLKIPYFDETPFRPDYLLNDLVRIFHPELSCGEPFHYFSPIK